MPGTVTDFESAFSRFPRGLETVISPRKQEHLEIEREERVGLNSFQVTSLDGFTLVVSRCDPLVIRPGFVIFHGFSRQEKCLAIICLCTATRGAHVISSEHCAGSQWSSIEGFFQDT